MNQVNPDLVAETTKKRPRFQETPVDPLSGAKRPRIQTLAKFTVDTSREGAVEDKQAQPDADIDKSIRSEDNSFKAPVTSPQSDNVTSGDEVSASLVSRPDPLTTSKPDARPSQEALTSHRPDVGSTDDNSPAQIPRTEATKAKPAPLPASKLVRKSEGLKKESAEVEQPSTPATTLEAKVAPSTLRVLPVTAQEASTRTPRSKWTTEEHNLFLQGLMAHSRDWKKVSALIGTKTAVQVRSHAQKYFIKLEKQGLKHMIPPPRVRRTAAPVSRVSMIPPFAHPGTKLPMAMPQMGRTPEGYPQFVAIPNMYMQAHLQQLSKQQASGEGQKHATPPMMLPGMPFGMMPPQLMFQRAMQQSFQQDPTKAVKQSDASSTAPAGGAGMPVPNMYAFPPTMIPMWPGMAPPPSTSSTPGQPSSSAATQSSPASRTSTQPVSAGTEAESQSAQ